MKFRFSVVLVFMVCCIVLSQTVRGKITDEDGNGLTSVTVMNISSDQKTYTNTDGTFSIDASAEDELRFIRVGYERASIQASYGIDKDLNIKLTRIAHDIEEVKVPNITGDLTKDARSVEKADKGRVIQDAVGLPQPSGKMREKPAEVKDVLIPIILGQLNVQGMYDLISGKARRQKRQYRYDDLQEDISWIRNRVEDEYFTKEGIPKERISELIEFSFLTKPQTRTFVRAKNLAGALLRMEEMIPVFKTRLQATKL